MVNRDDLLAFAHRDWQAIGRSRLRFWAEQYRRDDGARRVVPPTSSTTTRAGLAAAHLTIGAALTILRIISPCANDWIAPLVRSPVADLLADLSRGLAAAGIPWYLFGAQAAIVYGVARLTADVDVTARPPDGTPTARRYARS